MGLLKNLLYAGYISGDDYEAWAEKMEDAFDRFYHYGDVKAMRSVFEDLVNLGAIELIEEGWRIVEDAVQLWEEIYDYTIWYDYNVNRWRDSETGRFVANPYVWIRD